MPVKQTTLLPPQRAPNVNLYSPYRNNLKQNYSRGIQLPYSQRTLRKRKYLRIVRFPIFLELCPVLLSLFYRFCANNSKIKIQFCSLTRVSKIQKETKKKENRAYFLIGFLLSIFFAKSANHFKISMAR